LEAPDRAAQEGKGEKKNKKEVHGPGPELKPAVDLGKNCCREGGERFTYARSKKERGQRKDIGNHAGDRRT